MYCDSSASATSSRSLLRGRYFSLYAGPTVLYLPLVTDLDVWCAAHSKSNGGHATCASHPSCRVLPFRMAWVSQVSTALLCSSSYV